MLILVLGACPFHAPAETMAIPAHRYRPLHSSCMLGTVLACMLGTGLCIVLRWVVSEAARRAQRIRRVSLGRLHVVLQNTLPPGLAVEKKIKKD